MALPTSYLNGNFTKISQYFDAMLTARAPEKYTIKFMNDLGFTSSADRLFPNVLKSIGFLDDGGSPTDRYFKFLDQSCSKQMVAEGVKQAYSDLFDLNIAANTMTQTEVEGKFKTLTNGSKSPKTITCMAKTFLALCDYADWSENTEQQAEPIQEDTGMQEKITVTPQIEHSVSPTSPKLNLSYDIHIHLPATRDQAVYDALFASLAKHLPMK